MSTQAVNLTLKNAAGAATVFTLVAPAAGDNSWANWRNKVGPISSVFPRIAALARVGNKARKLNLKIQVPASFTDTVTGLTQVNATFDFDATVTVPDVFPESLKGDAVAFIESLFAQGLIKEMVRDAYPAT